MVLLAAPLLVLSLGGCHDSTGPKAAGPTSGHWVGTPSVYLPMDFTISQNDTLIAGTGTLSAPSGDQPMDVIGFTPTATPDSTEVVMTFSAENVVPGIFVGGMSQDGKTIHGTFQVAFLGTQDTVTFTRK